MRDIIEWLMHVEALANDVYREAAERFRDDREFSSFLSSLAEDEQWHFHLMGSAATLLEKEAGNLVPPIAVDGETHDRVEGPLRRCSRELKSESVVRERVLQGLYESEHSEWNDIFLYVVETCQQYSRMFQRIASMMQTHGRRIEAWFDRLPLDVQERVGKRTLPRVWKYRFLVVEDDPALRDLFRKILSMEGDVLTAANGAEGLSMARKGFFDVILSDQDMPIMTGTELCRLGLELDPAFGQHFILCTGNATSDVRLYCRTHGLKLLEKPVSVGNLRRAVLGIVHDPRYDVGKIQASQ